MMDSEVHILCSYIMDLGDVQSLHTSTLMMFF